MKPKSTIEQPTTEEGINLLAASKTLLRIVAKWGQNEYTEISSTEKGRQIEVRQHNDLSNPASAKDTSQGLQLL